MIEGGDRPGLALEALPPLGVLGELFGLHLDRDGTIEPGVARLVDLAHSPGADQSEDFIGAEARARSKGHATRVWGLYGERALASGRRLIRYARGRSIRPRG
jgi:hypothetical protein